MCALNKAFVLDITLDLSHWSKSFSPKCWTNLLCLVVLTEIWKSVSSDLLAWALPVCAVEGPLGHGRLIISMVDQPMQIKKLL